MSGSLNPKPYHIEIRRDSDVQGILLEDDIFAKSNEEAINCLIAWARLYNKTFKPEVGLVILCSNNWTNETLYQTIVCNTVEF